MPEVADGDLRAVLEHARDLGFLGPGDVDVHIRHAQAFVDALADVRGRVVDLGSGAGVPGLVVAARRPDLDVVLLEARARRCRHLEVAIERLGLRAEVVEGRAEVVGRSALRGTAAAVVARSFGPPGVTAECAAPFLLLEGTVVVSEPPPPPDPGRWPADGLARLGLRLGERRVGATTVQVLVQHRPCPSEYPRRDGQPAKQPLF